MVPRSAGAGRPVRLRPLEYVGISEDNVAEFEAAERDLAAGLPVQLEEGASE